ncbi:MAG: Ig-like domain-containing protein, partial [Elusimicrobiales bacterium]
MKQFIFVVSMLAVSSIITGSPAEAAVSFYGDWETGLVTGSGDHNWNHTQISANDPSRITVRPASDGGGHQGNYYARFEVRSGDGGGPGHTERSEVVHMKDAGNNIIYENATSGTVRYSFSVKFDPSWQTLVGDSNGAWGIFLQLHGDNGINPAWGFGATPDDTIVFGMRAGDVQGESEINRGRDFDLSNGSLNKGHWIDFILTVKYATDNTGSVSVQRKDEGDSSYTQVLSVTNVPTLQYNDGSATGNHYMKHGLYSNYETFTRILYTDGFTREVVTDPGSYTLTVTKSGTGAGTVSGGGINCGAACSASFSSGEVATLSTAAAAGSTFTGWSGACSGMGHCAVTMNSDAAVNAVFTDTAAPTVSVTAPTAGATVSGTIGVTASASDNVGVSRVDFYVDGSLQGSDTSSPYAYSLNTTSLSNAAHTITARAYDAAGNNAVSAGVSVTVDNTGACATATTAFQNYPFAEQSGIFTAQFDATPDATNDDAVTALSSGPAAVVADMAAIIRFSNTGVIEVRNAGAYASDLSVPYIAGADYHFRMTVNPAAHTYSVHVTTPGASEVSLASNYAFRSEQSSLARLNNMTMTAFTGSHSVCNFSISGGASDVSSPTVTAFTIPATSGSLNIAITALTATDDTGVTGYLVNESATRPLPGAGGWTAGAPASYVFASAGAKTLYAWAKDAAGNVSASLNGSITITLPDVSSPTVTAFT